MLANMYGRSFGENVAGIAFILVVILGIQAFFFLINYFGIRSNFGIESQPEEEVKKIVCKCGAKLLLTRERLESLAGTALKCKKCGRKAKVPSLLL